MATILDTAILVGEETTYGTTASAWDRAYEGKADSFARSQEPLESIGFRPGMHTVRSDRRRPINMGGEGSLEVDVLDQGFGLLLQAMLGTVTGPTQVGATDAYDIEADSATDLPTPSYSVQVQRIDSSGTKRSFTHKGAVITGWEISQDVNGLLTANLNFDFQDVVTDEVAGSPSYPTGALPFDWTQCAVTVDGSAVDVKTYSLTAELGLKTDRRYLKGSALKARPLRAAVPSFSGTLEVDFQDLTLYNAFVSGEVMPIVATWTGSAIDVSNDFQVVVTLPACQFDGESPSASLDDLTTQAAPFRVLHNGTDPAVTIALVTTDTTL